MEIKLEDTELGRQATVEKIKMNAAINTMTVKELNYLEEKVRSVKRMKTEKTEEDWGVETELHKYGNNCSCKNVDEAEASI